VVPPGGFEPP